jgi:hypothetical protein
MTARDVPQVVYFFVPAYAADGSSEVTRYG